MSRDGRGLREGGTQLTAERRHTNALGTLIPLIYDDLHRLAASYLRHERVGHTLQPTALLHEAYLRLRQQREIQWQSRTHFMSIAAQSMRRVLVDYARARRSRKRGGAEPNVPLTVAPSATTERAFDVLALDGALQELAVLDLRQCRIVELRYFGGMTIDETAEALEVSPTTVKDEWCLAKAWLYRRLKK